MRKARLLETFTASPEPSSNTFIRPDATYFEENGLGILSGPSVYATFNCCVNLIEP
jgi:hypothetical protein